MQLIAAMLGLFALTHMAAIGSTLMELDFLARAELGAVTIEEGEANDARVMAIGGVSTVVYLLCATIIATFLYRANKNAQVLAGPTSPLAHTAGWTVGWFFVPFANLVKPYHAVSEIWTVSQPAVPGILPLWWAAWLAMSLGGSISSQFATRATTVQDFIVSDYIALAHSGIAIAAAAVCFLVVRGLQRAQSAHHDRGQPQLPT